MITIPEYVMAILFFGTAAVSLRRKLYDGFITRLAIAMFFVYMIIFPIHDIEWARSVSRYLYSLLALVEIISFVAYSIQQKRFGGNK